jgi:acyl-CoA synthetase (AMP-forming)/AMP-acid ligase II
LFYVGRTSELIKAAGANVSPLEVEAVVEQFAEVAQCVVVGVDDPERGEEVCAVIVPAGPALDVQALSARVREQLSAYKVPTRWVIAESHQIPTLASGKLNRKGVRALVIEGGFG